MEQSNIEMHDIFDYVLIKIDDEISEDEIFDYVRIKIVDEISEDGIEDVNRKVRNFSFYVYERSSDFDLGCKCLFNWKEIEKYLNDNLYKYDFGESVKELYFIYYILDFNIEGNKKYIDNEIQKYKYFQNQKIMDIIKIFDAKKMKKCIKPRNKNKKHWTKCTKEDQIKYLHKGMLEAINRIDAMENRPKDFNVEYLYEIIDKLMNDYEERICHGGDGGVTKT